MKKFSCIIPAYNEAEDIGRVLSVVVPLIGTQLFEVIVVDDASSDGTKEIVSAFPSVRLIVHDRNQGKSKSVADGILVSSGEYIFLLDADLKFLNSQNIIDLVTPVEDGRADMSISYRKNAWPLFPFKAIDYLSGERILPKACLVSSLGDMARLPGYGLEVFLNRIIIKNHFRIAVVHWPNVENNFKQNRHGWWKGMQVIMRIWLNVLSTVSVVEMYTQNIRMKKLLVRSV